MCYEFSNWFEKARAKELHKAREKLDQASRTPAPEPAVPAPASKRPQVNETEKAPA